ncbi:Gfo/Idh/MocA family oxidoreductase, partial [Verrucomicrobiales bacterium]|nr:Gfo/Idh/MocA family oxidoreductase [Verrucomicrobiales bacterium]
MKIAVIGAGAWGINLIRNLRDLDVLSHVVEKELKLAKRITSEAPQAILLDKSSALLDMDINAVAIATPAQTHFKIASQFLNNGKDVFIEKPMTLNSQEAEKLVEIAEKKDCILMVGHLLLYQPAIRFIKDYIGNGNLGGVYHLHQQRMKLGRVRSFENVAWSLGVHDIAVLLYLVGSSPEQINCIGHCSVQSQIEDDIYIHMRFKDGIVAHLHNSWLWPEQIRDLKIIGEKGMLVYDEIKQTVVLHKKRVGQNLQNIDEGEEILFKGSAQPLRLEMEHFINCIRSRSEPISHGRSGVDVIRVLES